MKCNKLIAAGFVVLLAFLSGCASTKAPRSLNASASKIKSIKAAAELAENYGLTVISDSRNSTKEKAKLDKSKLNIQDLFIAKNSENDEVIVFATIKGVFVKYGTTYDKGIFSYSSINGEKTSVYRILVDHGEFTLSNKDKLCEYDASGYYITDEQYKGWTIGMAKLRASFKNLVEKRYPIHFEDEINSEQKRLTGLDR